MAARRHRRTRRVDRRHAGRLGDPGEVRPPGPFRGGPVTRGEPAEVVTVVGRGQLPGRVLVERDEIGQERRGRPAVEQQVVVRQHEPVPVGPHAREQRAHQRGRGRIEPAALHRAFALPRGVDVRGVGEIDLPPRHRDRPPDQRDRPSRRQVAEPGAQLRVPHEQRVDGAAPLLGVERAVEIEGELHRVDVCRVAGLQLGLEQQAGLQGRERQHVDEIRHGRGHLGGLGRVQLDEREPGRRRHVGPYPGDGGEPGRGAGPEHVPCRDDQPGHAGAGHELHRDDAVATEGEEVVVDADPVQPEHAGDHAAQHLLARGARARVRHRQLGDGQRGHVELARSGARQLAEHDDRRRHHVRGQPPGGVLAHGLGCPAHHVGDEPAHAGRVLADHHGRCRDVRVVRQHGLHLAGLDAEPAQRQLAVGTAEDAQHAVVGPGGEIAAAVHACPALPRVGDEPLRGGAGPVQVSAGHAGAGHVQLARHAGRDGLQAARPAPARAPPPGGTGGDRPTAR